MNHSQIPNAYYVVRYHSTKNADGSQFISEVEASNGIGFTVNEALAQCETGCSDHYDKLKIYERVYKIVRMYRNERPNRTQHTYMNILEARKHCRDPSSRKAGVWFDGYTKMS